MTHVNHPMPDIVNSVTDNHRTATATAGVDTRAHTAAVVHVVNDIVRDDVAAANQRDPVARAKGDDGVLQPIRLAIENDAGIPETRSPADQLGVMRHIKRGQPIHDIVAAAFVGKEGRGEKLQATHDDVRFAAQIHCALAGFDFDRVVGRVVAGRCL